jgi:hypothetical protein
MYKIPKTKFNYMGDMLTHRQIRNKLGKVKRCRKLRLYYNEALVDFFKEAKQLLGLKYRFEHYEMKNAA